MCSNSSNPLAFSPFNELAIHPNRFKGSLELEEPSEELREQD
jgi:hypothetical protein